MAEIKTTPLGGGRFRVEVIEGTSSTAHEVTVAADTISRYGWNGTPEDLLRRSFDFLLERESKESILRSFELSEIARFFPEYEEAVRKGFA
jgi:hypothetical protein